VDSLLWSLLVFFVLLDVHFAMMRTAVLNAQSAKLVAQTEKKPKAVQATLNMIKRPRLRASFRIALSFTHILVAALAGWAALATWGEVLSPISWIGFLLGVMLALLMLEFAAERLPLKNPELWAMRLRAFALLLDWEMTPFSWLMIALQGSKGRPAINDLVVTEDELKVWVETEQPEGGLEKGERRMIQSIFEFGETLCREIMVPRIDVLALDVNTPLKEATDALVKSGHSRVPVFEDSIDNIIGLLYAKDLLKVGSANDLRKLLRKAYFIPESKKVDELLAEMQGRGVHMAVVVDEYGGMAGVVTLEDIVEEIVGEIRDEYDTAEELPVLKVSADEFLFKGQIDLDDVNELLGSQMTNEYSDSLGGFVYSELGRVPGAGDDLQVGDWKFTVEEVRGHRIGKIRAQRTPPATGENG
jgi:putative hemolysin